MTLQSPEATKQLVDSIVKVNEETGETSLHIPVPDKESVANVLSILENCLAENKKEISSDHRFLTANRQFLRKLSVEIDNFAAF